jgi:hypothetical protein
VIADKLKEVLSVLREFESKGEIVSFEDIADRFGLETEEVERLVDILIITGKVTEESVGGTCGVSSSCSKCPLRTVCSKSTSASRELKTFKLS